MWRPWLRLPKADRDAMRSALHAAAWVWVSLFVTAFLGWLADLSDWLTEEAPFPDWHVLVTALAAAIVAVFTLVLSAVLGIAQAHLKSDKGDP